MEFVLAEEVADREVIELDTNLTDDTRLTPTQRELQLVVRLLFESVVDIHRSVLIVGHHIGHHLLRIEESHGGDLTDRTLQGFLVEQVTGLCAELTAHHLFVEAVVTIDADTVEVGLRTFRHTHLHIDGVVVDIDFHGLDVREHVTVVVIVVTSGIIVFFQTLVHVLLVIHVTFLHAQHGIQVVGGYHGVSHPGDVTDIVFVTFVEFHIDIHVLVVVGADGVNEDGGIAESQLVVFLDKGLLGFLIAFVGELLRLEEAGEFSRLVDLTEGTFADERSLDLRVLQFLITVEDDTVYLHLGLFVDIHIEQHLVLVTWVLCLQDVDLRVLITLLIEVFLGEDLRTVHNVTGETHALHDTQFRLQVFALSLLHTVIADGVDTGAHAQMDAEIDFRTYDRVGGDADL